MTGTLLETTGGTVPGALVGGVRTFLGVPYGASTAGAGRFRAPRPVEPWDGVRDALDYGASSWQRGAVGDEQVQIIRDMLAMWGGGPEPSMSEDCLVLNVWAPAEVSQPVPVVVYLHGGGHSIGSGSWAAYDGWRLASRGDVVVVTVNHRLGLLAYCYLAELLGPEFATSGINGILDIVEALRWVRANIGLVGGDPGRVFVCGQSGGGAKVAALLATPTSYGLYHGVGIMSAPNPQLVPTETAASTTEQLLGRLGITTADAEQLLTIPAERLVEAQQAVGNPLSSFAPVVDGTWAVAQPLDAVAGGRAPDVPLFIGTTARRAPRRSRPPLSCRLTPTTRGWLIRSVRSSVTTRSGSWPPTGRDDRPRRRGSCSSPSRPTRSSAWVRSGSRRRTERPLAHRCGCTGSTGRRTRTATRGLRPTARTRRSSSTTSSARVCRTRGPQSARDTDVVVAGRVRRERIAPARRVAGVAALRLRPARDHGVRRRDPRRRRPRLRGATDLGGDGMSERERAGYPGEQRAGPERPGSAAAESGQA